MSPSKTVMILLLATVCCFFEGSLARCGTYDRTNFTCCRGRTYPGADLSCCGNVAYDNETQICCTNVVQNLGSGPKLCCGTTAYIPGYYTCCDGSLYIGQGQNCSSPSLKHQCRPEETVVVGCYKKCSCDDVLGRTAIPDQCGTMCEDCIGAQGQFVGCAPKCECDAQRSFVRDQRGACVQPGMCRRAARTRHS